MALRARILCLRRPAGVLRVEMKTLPVKMKMRLIKDAQASKQANACLRTRLRRPGGAKRFAATARRLIEYGCCKGVQGPSSGLLNLNLCVRRPDVLGVEMKTLPVKPHSGPPITGASIAPAATRVYTPHEFRTSGSKTPGGAGHSDTHTRGTSTLSHTGREHNHRPRPRPNRCTCTTQYTVQKHPGGAETHTRFHSPCILVLPISKHHTPLRALLWEGVEPQECLERAPPLLPRRAGTAKTR